MSGVDLVGTLNTVNAVLPRSSKTRAFIGFRDCLPGTASGTVIRRQILGELAAKRAPARAAG